MLEFIIFHTTPPALSITGTAMIMSSAIYITVRQIVPQLWVVLIPIQLTKREVVTKPVTEPAS